MPITFDGVNRIITLESGVTDVDASVIYSRWKDWIQVGDNAKYNPAFRVVGGDPVSATQNAGSYFFIQNQTGYDWRIKPPEEDIGIVVSGNLVVEDVATIWRIPTVGAFTASIDRNFSALTTETVQTTGSGLSSAQATQLEELHQINGLSSGSPVVHTPSSTASGSITIEHTGDCETSVTSTRL